MSVEAPRWDCDAIIIIVVMIIGVGKFDDDDDNNVEYLSSKLIYVLRAFFSCGSYFSLGCMRADEMNQNNH